MAPGRQLAAIMFTDMVGSTLLAQRDERSALALIEEHERLARPIAEAHHGRLVKSIGDGLLIEFPSALDAIESAVELQARARARNQPPAAVPLTLRIGIHLGDVQRRGDDILGDAVNVAARVESMAEPGGICLSASVFAQVRHKVPYALEPLGARAMKGVREPMELYRVGPVAREAGEPVRGAPSPRLAVLPLANISPDAQDGYFADGLTEELIGVLSKIPGLRVIARTSVLPYRSREKSVAQIGSELGVGSVLDGSVRKAGDRLRISLQLIDVASQEPIWSERYDRELSDVFAIQTEVAESTAKAIRLELSEPAKAYLRRAPTSDLAAYELYLRAILLRDDLTPEAFRESVALLEAAVGRDPEFALAFAQLAFRLVEGAGDFLPRRAGFEQARTHVARALALDPELSEAHTALANLAMQDDNDWERAEAQFERALALNPSNTLARVNYSTLLHVLGRHAEAEQQLRAAVETDPKSWAARWLLVDSALSYGTVELAEDRLRELLPGDLHPALTQISFALRFAKDGREREARRALDRAGSPPALIPRIGRAVALAALGEPEEARAILRELTGGTPPGFVPQDYVAVLYVAVGEKERGLEVIEAAARTGDSGLRLRHRAFVFDPIRSDPRFLAVLRRFHLPAADGNRPGSPNR